MRAGQLKQKTALNISRLLNLPLSHHRPSPRDQVAALLSNLPAYRTGVSPLLRGVEIGLTHGFFVTGPFIKVSTPLDPLVYILTSGAACGLRFKGVQADLTPQRVFLGGRDPDLFVPLLRSSARSAPPRLPRSPAACPPSALCSSSPLASPSTAPSPSRRCALPAVSSPPPLILPATGPPGPFRLAADVFYVSGQSRNRSEGPPVLLCLEQDEVVGVKTLSGRKVARDPLQSSEGCVPGRCGRLPSTSNCDGSPDTLFSAVDLTFSCPLCLVVCCSQVGPVHRWVACGWHCRRRLGVRHDPGAITLSFDHFLCAVIARCVWPCRPTEVSVFCRVTIFSPRLLLFCPACAGPPVLLVESGCFRLPILCRGSAGLPVATAVRERLRRGPVVTSLYKMI